MPVDLRRYAYPIAFFTAALAPVLACGDILDDTPDPVPTRADAASMDGGVLEAAARTCRSPELTAIADTGIAKGQCAQSISYSTAPGLNIGVGYLLVRFKLDSDTATRVREGRIESMRLTLFDNRTCDDGCGDVPPIRGKLVAHVLRNDWDEGTVTDDYSGADFCRRRTGNPGIGWGTDGAAHGDPNKTAISSPADYSAPVGSAIIESATITRIEIPLDAASVATAWASHGAPGETELSLVVTDANDARFVAASRESKIAAPPTLTIEVCEP